MTRIARLLVAAGLFGLAAAACTASGRQETPALTQTVLLTPYWTSAPSRTPTPPDPATPTPLPSPTPTPRIHTVKQGETIISIAITYGLTIDALLAANPEIDPNLMSIGAQLVVPPSAGESSAPPASAPTPVAVEMSVPNCLPSQEGGAWCFALAYNNQDVTIESLTAVMRLVDPLTGEVSSQNVSAPITLLPPAGSMPLAAYFAPPRQPPFQASIEILSALPGRTVAELYLPVEIHNEKIEILPGGQSAEISGELALAEGESRAAVVRVVGIALDAAGEVIGLRRWENQVELSAGEGAAYVLRVYSAGGEITRVETLFEALPAE